MGVQFRLLGDVEVEIDGRVVDAGHARQLCVLVALLVDANRVVPVDQLLDRVWAQRPPQRARTTLSGYLSRLRQVLSGVDGVQIARRSGGYMLGLDDPSVVDLHRFRDLVARARAAAPDEAAALFDQARRLWRGEAFAALDTPWLAGIRETLSAERLAATLDSHDLALDRGRHRDILAELSGCADERPLDERVAGQLMLALYRCGRQADALDRYEGIRRRLADELGADPSPPLQWLHRQILAADPALSLAAGGPTVPRPRQLPAPPASFTGRAKELAELDALLAAGGGSSAAVVISAVAGTAGVGKTALALHWAHRVADRFPDGQLYVNLRGFDPAETVMAPAEALRALLDALVAPQQQIPAGLDARAGLYRSLLASRQILVVLDNARDTDQVRPLLPATPGCLTVVTSRNELIGLIAGEGARPVTLDLLSHAEARDLLLRRLGPDRLDQDRGAVDEIIERCARLPLALTIVAARAASHPALPLAALAGELRDALAGLDRFAGGDAGADIRAAFATSYDALGQPAARLFRLLGLLPGPDLTTTAAASLAGLTPAKVRAPLAELTRAHLILEHAPDRYTLHDLLRAYATERGRQLDPAFDRHAALHRLLDHYLHSAHAAAHRLNPHREPLPLAPAAAGTVVAEIGDERAAARWLDTENAALLAAIARGHGAGFDAHTWQLAWALGEFLDRRGQWHELATAHLAALAATQRSGDPAGQALSHRGLGGAFSKLGRYDEAYHHFGRALDLCVSLGDQVGEALVHLNLNLVLDRLGRHRLALHHGRRAHSLFRAADHLSGQVQALNAIGWQHSQLGEHDRAVAYCRQGLVLCDRVDDKVGRAGILDSLGYAYHRLGFHQQAIDCYRQAHQLFGELGDRFYEAWALTHLGDAHDAAGDAAAARDTWSQALAILDQLGHEEAGQVRARLKT